MNIELKLTPIFQTDSYCVETNVLKIPVLFSYEDKNGIISFNVENGFPILGKVHPETRTVSYFVGDSGSITQLSSFINNLRKKLPCNMTISENLGNVNSIEFDPIKLVWIHRNVAQDLHFGGTLTLQMTDGMLQQFVKVLDEYYRFAFMSIEGHKQLWNMEHTQSIF